MYLCIHRSSYDIIGINNQPFDIITSLSLNHPHHICDRTIYGGTAHFFRALDVDFADVILSYFQVVCSWCFCQPAITMIVLHGHCFSLRINTTSCWTLLSSSFVPVEKNSAKKKLIYYMLWCKPKITCNNFRFSKTMLYFKYDVDNNIVTSPKLLSRRLI